MLLLTRKPGDKVICTIPPSDSTRTLEFVVLGVKGNQVRVGIEADDSIHLMREEVVLRPDYIPPVFEKNSFTKHKRKSSFATPMLEMKINYKDGNRINWG